MNKNEIRKKADEYLSRYAKTPLTAKSLKQIIELQGYTVIEFNNISNDEDVETVISELKLTVIASKSKGFTYVDSLRRLVFVNEDLSPTEQLHVLAHEQGHIYCEHFGHASVIGRDVEDEHEANEFSHYILNPSAGARLRMSLLHRKRLYITLAAVLILCTSTGFAAAHYVREAGYYGEYYVTATGNRYHEKNCTYIEGKSNVRRLTKEDYESGEYAPCKVCQP